MSRCYINEYSHLPLVNGQMVTMAQEPCLASQAFEIDDDATHSAPFNSATRYIMVHVDDSCSYKVGENPDVGIKDMRMAANETRFMAVQPNHKIAVILND